LRISLQPNLEPALDADFDDARRSERLGPAIRRSPGAGTGKERRQGDGDPH
jgi:hypothetical protein